MKKLRDEYVIQAISEKIGVRQEYMNIQELQFISKLSIGDKESKKISFMKDYSDLDVLKYLDSGATVELYSIDLSRKVITFGKNTAKIRLVNCNLYETQIVVENANEEYTGYALEIESCKFEKLSLSLLAMHAKSINIIGRTQYTVSREKDYQLLETEMLKVNPNYLELREEEKFELLRSNGYIEAVAPEVKLYSVDNMSRIKSIQVEGVCIADLELTDTDKFSSNKTQIETLKFVNCEFKNCHSTFVLKVSNLYLENCKVYIEDVLSNFYGINTLKIISTTGVKFRYLGVSDKIENVYVENCETPFEGEDLKQISKTVTLTLINVKNNNLQFKKLLKFKLLKKLHIIGNVTVEEKILNKLKKIMEVIIEN